MTQEVDRMQLLLWECNENTLTHNMDKDTPDFMGVSEQTSHGSSNMPTFSQITQVVP